MSSKSKKVFSFVLVLLMVVSMMPLQVFAANKVANPWKAPEIKSNAFLSSLKYLGYDTSYYTNSWTVGSSVPRAGRTNIGYDYDYGTTGLETTSGKPNVSYFEKNGFCCASFAAYVYFNYLPNVYGLDMSFLSKPTNTASTSSWLTACESWAKSNVADKILINKSLL